MTAVSDIFDHPTATMTPEGLLRKDLRNVAEVAVAATVLLMKDGTIRVKWSETTYADLSMMERVFSLELNDAIRDFKQGQ